MSHPIGTCLFWFIYALPFETSGTASCGTTGTENVSKDSYLCNFVTYQVCLCLFLVLILIIQACTPKGTSAISPKQVFASASVVRFCRNWTSGQSVLGSAACPLCKLHWFWSQQMSRRICPWRAETQLLSDVSSKLSLWERCIYRVRPPHFIEFVVGEQVFTSASSWIGAIGS